MLATQVQYWTLLENRLHNRNMEAQARNELLETVTSHRNDEAERNRHNLVSEQLGRDNLQLGRDTLSETIRNNSIMQSIAQQNADTNKRNAEIGAMQAQASFAHAAAAMTSAQAAQMNAATNAYLAPSQVQERMSSTSYNNQRAAKTKAETKTARVESNWAQTNQVINAARNISNTFSSISNGVSSIFGKRQGGK
nr:putative ORF1 [Marmot picobirnavirus]